MGALNLRSVEERARSEITTLEMQKTQLEQQQANLQVQLQEEQQKCSELSMSLGETQLRLSQLEDNTGGIDTDEAQLAAQAEVQELQKRIRIAEEKLLDSQSTRDMFAKDMDMYRSELK